MEESVLHVEYVEEKCALVEAARLEPTLFTTSEAACGSVWKYKGLTLTWGRFEKLEWLVSATTEAAPILDGEGCCWTGGSLNGDSGLVDLPPSGVVEFGDLLELLFWSLSWAKVITRIEKKFCNL